MNHYILCFLPIALPVLFWACYHAYKDRHLPEPAGHLLLAFGLGIGSSYLAMLMYQALDPLNLRFDAFLLAETSLPALFAYSVLAIGLIEELAKMIPFLLVVLRFREFDEPIDGIIYGSFIALGFASVENFHYLHALSGWEAWARGFAGPVVHIVFASIWGYHIGKANLTGRALARTVVAVLLFTALLHGIYDFIAIGMADSALPIAASLILALWIWRLRLIQDLHGVSEEPGRQEPSAVADDARATAGIGD